MGKIIKVQIGDGKSISLQFDNWLPCRPIIKRFGPCVIYDLELKKEAKVNEIINDGIWKWPTTNSIELLELKRAIVDKQIGNREYYILWTLNASNCFSIKSTQEVFLEPKRNSP